MEAHKIFFPGLLTWDTNPFTDVMFPVRYTLYLSTNTRAL